MCAFKRLKAPERTDAKTFKKSVKPKASQLSLHDLSSTLVRHDPVLELAHELVRLFGQREGENLERYQIYVTEYTSDRRLAVCGNILAR